MTWSSQAAVGGCGGGIIRAYSGGRGPARGQGGLPRPPAPTWPRWYRGAGSAIGRHKSGGQSSVACRTGTPGTCAGPFWVIVKSVFEFQGLCGCCQSASSVWVSLSQSASTLTKSLPNAVQSRRCESSAEKKKRKQLCAHKLDSHQNPLLGHSRYFDTAIAQVPLKIKKICTSVSVTPAFVPVWSPT